MHVTSAHPLQDTRIYVKEACSLAVAGYRVAIIGPKSSSNSGREKPETCKGVEIISLPQPKGRLGRFFGLGRQLYLIAKKSNAKAIHIHDPDLMIAGLLLYWQGKRVVYDVHEDYSKSMLSRAWLRLVGLHKISAVGVRWLENRVSSRFAGFVLADKILAKPFPQKRSVVVRNYLQPTEWPKEAAPNRKSTDIRCIYVGDISVARGFLAMCDAIHLARSRGINVSLTLVGKIPTDLKKALQDHPAKNYIFLKGQCNRKEVSASLQNSDIAFFLPSKAPAYLEALPVKILEYLMAALPVICTDTPRLQAETGLIAGLHFCSSNEPERVVEKLHEIIKDRAHARTGALKARQAVLQKYNWASEEEKLVQFYRDLLGE